MITPQRMSAQSQPYVLLDREFPDINANYVGVDDRKVGRMATEHLLDIGCRNIAHIFGRGYSTGNRRFEGYKEALENRGVPFSEDYAVHGAHVDTQGIEQGAAAMRILLQRNPRPDGVFCLNDLLAIGAMNAILDAGLRIPEDIAIIGCGNLPYNDSLRVGLSSIDQHTEKIGGHAAEIILDLLEKPNSQPTRTVILEPALVVRASSRRN